jgi:hypothetical protein
VNLGKSLPVLGNDEPSALYLLPAFLHDVGGRIWVGLCKSNSISVRIPNDRAVLGVPQTIEIGQGLALAQAEFIIECSPAYRFPILQAVVTLQYPRRNGPRNRHILLDTIAGSTKNVSHLVVFGRLKSFRSNEKGMDVVQPGIHTACS